MTPQTTIDQVTVSARVHVVDNLRVDWLHPADLDTHCAEIITTYRPGDDPRTLEFGLDQLKAICREQAKQYPEVRIAIDLIPFIKDTVVSNFEQGAQLTVTFGTDYANAPANQEQALAFANELIDRLHNRM
jgi:hypothetical protein